MNKTVYYAYHIVWNFLINFTMSAPFSILFYYLNFNSFQCQDMVFVILLGSLGTSLFNMIIAVQFQNKTSGLNFISLLNMLLSITGSYAINNPAVSVLKKLMPQNFILGYFNDLIQSKGDSSKVHYLKPLFLQCLVYSAIFYSLEKFLPNEYGYKEKSFFESIWSIFGSLIPSRYKKRKRRVSDGLEAAGLIDRPGSDLDLDQAVTEEPIIRICNVKKSFGKNQVLKSVTMDLNRGESLCLLGCNGAGKSTLFNIILKNIEATSGSILNFSDEDDISFCPQHDFNWDYFTVKEHFEFVGLLREDYYRKVSGVTTENELSQITKILDNSGSLNSSRESSDSSFDLGGDDEEAGAHSNATTLDSSFSTSPTKNRSQRARMGGIEASKGSQGFSVLQKEAYIEKVKDICLLRDHWNVQARKLSGGYKRRLSLALSLLCNTKVILMDEPTTALDIETRRRVMKAIRDAQKSLGKTILFTTHHLEDAENFADRIVILKQGKVSLNGTIDELTAKFNSVYIDVSNVSETEGYLIEQRLGDEIQGLQVESWYNEEKGFLAMKMAVRGVEDKKNLLRLVRFLERTEEHIIDLRKVSLEEVFLMENESGGVFDSPLGGLGGEDAGLGGVGAVDLRNCWQEVLSARKEPGFVAQLRAMLSKSEFLKIFLDFAIFWNC